MNDFMVLEVISGFTFSNITFFWVLLFVAMAPIIALSIVLDLVEMSGNFSVDLP